MFLREATSPPSPSSPRPAYGGSASAARWRAQPGPDFSTRRKRSQRTGHFQLSAAPYRLRRSTGISTEGLRHQGTSAFGTYVTERELRMLLPTAEARFSSSP